VVLDLLSRFTAAEEALAASVDTYESITDHWQWQDSPEAQAALALNEEVVGLCHAARELGGEGLRAVGAVDEWLSY